VNVWRRAHHVAHSQLGNDSLVQEIMEIAIEGAVCRLQTDSPQGPEYVASLLERLFLQEVRRRRKANNRLVYLGSNQELLTGSAQNPHTLVDSAIDLDRILRGIPPDVRIALLLRYSRSDGAKLPRFSEPRRQLYVFGAKGRSTEFARNWRSNS